MLQIFQIDVLIRKLWFRTIGQMDVLFANCGLGPEIDFSVSKLLGFETFANFLRVSVSVSENLVLERSLGFGFGKLHLEKKVSVSENLVSKKKYWFWFRKT